MYRGDTQKIPYNLDAHFEGGKSHECQNTPLSVQICPPWGLMPYILVKSIYIHMCHWFHYIAPKQHMEKKYFRNNHSIVNSK